MEVVCLTVDDEVRAEDTSVEDDEDKSGTLVLLLQYGVSQHS